MERMKNPPTTALDVIIVGAGSAGLSALREVRRHTEHFAIVNDGPWGSTCARVGCMPSKLLIEAANAFHRRHGFETFGIRGAQGLSVDLPAVLRRVRKLRDEFVASTLQATEGLAERAVQGRARLLGPDRIEVGGKVLAARKLILAPGSSPVVPEAWKKFGKRILTTDSLFERKTLGPRVAVVGLGAIGVEIAQALARLGLEVTALGRGPRLAGLSDPQVTQALRGLMEREMTVITDHEAELSKGPDASIVIHAGPQRFVVDHVVAAMGRRPQIEGLGLETLGLPLDEHGLPPVDAHTLQVAGLPLFLVGDANGQRALLHEAVDEGHIAGLNAMAETMNCFARRTPLSVVFSDPQAAVVGQPMKALLGRDFVVGRVDFAHQGRARAAQCNAGLLHVYADRADGRLLGAEMCAPAGEHLAHLLALALQHGLSAHELLTMPFYHPVLEEGLRSALRDATRQLAQAEPSDLGRCEPLPMDSPGGLH
jgi:dihydrolipoamide dehydrogenase